MLGYELIIYLLATAGLAIAVSWSKIFSPIRGIFDVGKENRRAMDNPLNGKHFARWEKISNFIWSLLTCPFCVAFWCGFAVYALMNIGEIGYVICLSLSASAVTYPIYRAFYGE